MSFDHKAFSFDWSSFQEQLARLLTQALLTSAPAELERFIHSQLRDCETGKERLRAGFPGNWIVGDKTGTGARGATNDLAIAMPPGRAPVLVAAYMSEGGVGPTALHAAHADCGRLVAREFVL